MKGFLPLAQRLICCLALPPVLGKVQKSNIYSATKTIHLKDFQVIKKKKIYLNHNSLYDIESLLVILNETTQNTYYYISVWQYRLKPLIVNPVLN